MAGRHSPYRRSRKVTTIRKIRDRLQLTQAALAAKLGVSRVTVARWETGVHAPHKTFVEKMKELR